MKPELSPFKPGQTVPLEFFVGRIKEIERLQSMVKASTRGQFKIGFISGERGIGKSSLASFVHHLSDSSCNAGRLSCPSRRCRRVKRDGKENI